MPYQDPIVQCRKCSKEAEFECPDTLCMDHWVDWLHDHSESSELIENIILKDEMED